MRLPFYQPVLSQYFFYRLCCAFLTVFISAGALAQTVDIDIPRLPLGQALIALAKQSGTSILADSTLIKGKLSTPTKGRLALEDALKQMMEGSGLTYQVSNSGSIRIVLAEQQAVQTAAKKTLVIEDKRLEEVLVSAGRRRQSLSKYAGTLNAFNEQQLRSWGAAADLQSIQTAVPGVQISLNEGFQEIYVRGIGTQDNRVSSDQPTALHYNNAYVPKLRGLGPVIFDIERVEVHHGPQGTLRGRNASAGSINIISTPAKLDERELNYSIDTGSYDLRQQQAQLNLPVLENVFALRLASHRKTHDGFYKNARRDQDAIEAASDVGSADEKALRVSARWQADEAFLLDLVYDKSSVGGSGFPGNYAGQTFSQGFQLDELDDPWRQFFQTRGQVDFDIESLIAKQSFRFDGILSEFILSHRRHDGLSVNPRRPFQHGFVNPIIKSVDDISVWAFDNYNTNWISDSADVKSLEIRLASDRQDAPHYWTGGLYFFDENASEFRWDISDAPALNQSNLGGPDLSKADAMARSLYFDASFSLAEALRLSTGMRYTNEKKSSARWDARLFFTGLRDSMDFDSDGDTQELLSSADALQAQVRLGTPGFAIVPARKQNLVDPNSFPNAFAFLNSLVAHYGERDNLQELISAQNMRGDVLTLAPQGIARSDFSDNYIDWRLGLEADLSSTQLFYTHFSTGTRAGGINPPIFVVGKPVRDTFDNERLQAFELGHKWQIETAHSDVFLHTAAFYYHYKNQIFQIGTIGDDIASDSTNPGNGSNINADLRQANANIGRSRAYGLSVDAQAQLPHQLRVAVNFLLLDTKIVSGATTDGRQSPQLLDKDGDGTFELVAPPLIDLAGNPLINSPRIAGNLGLIKAWTLADTGSVEFGISASYKSHFHATPFKNRGFNFDGEEIPLRDMQLCCDTQFADANGDGETEIGDGRFYNDKVPASLILNANVAVNFGRSERYRLELFGRNLSNQAYAQKQIINSAVNIVFLNTPRELGLRFEAAIL